MDESGQTAEPVRSAGVTAAVQHALGWLVFGNALGVMIAILLLLPQLNSWLGEWTYGRWMMVHMNTALFGWCSLPILALLFKAYGADRGSLAAWCRPVVWLWSAALVVGSYSWLQGHSSGKLFLDWSGYARVFFPLALLGFWVLLAIAFARNRESGSNGPAVLFARLLGLLALLPVPLAIYLSSSPNNYPAVNPATGGPTAASQLESTLGVVLILLAVPFGVAGVRKGLRRIAIICCAVFLAESVMTALLGFGDVSHRIPAQYLSLASVLAWIPLIRAFYSHFEWTPATRRWRTAFLAWWAGLVITGWVMFLPGVLDRVKFTDALVGHSLLAVAGFLSAYVVFILVQVLGEQDAWILNRTWSFYAWNLGVLAYVIVIMVAGWIEGTNPAFTIVPGADRNIIYVVRLLTGIAMLAGSVEWLLASLTLKTEAASAKKIEMQGAKVA
jgi:cytochrome c oxidase cbb3-type subunit I